MSDGTFYRGLIEGFYGQPWSEDQRRELFGRMSAWGLNAYLYAPKDDLKHRRLWRSRYEDREAAALARLIGACESRGIRFVYGIAPGLDIEHGADADRAALFAKCAQARELGCRGFAFLFDDIGGGMKTADQARFGSTARAQAFVVNESVERLRREGSEGPYFFCPTPYCERMSGPVERSAYLSDLGAELSRGIDVFWTGPDIVSREIRADSLRRVGAALRRKPILWDNFHANDYDMRRMYLGPYAGRAPEILKETSGILINPNCEHDLNFVALRTFARFVNEPSLWDSRRAYLDALKEWAPDWRLEESGKSITAEDLELICDCFYQPYALGRTAAERLEDLEAILAGSPGVEAVRLASVDRWCEQVVELCERLTSLKNRSLLYALYRRLWELKEELTLVRRYLEWRAKGPDPSERFESDEHRPGVYRGGLAARLQALLPMSETGEFEP